MPHQINAFRWLIAGVFLLAASGPALAPPLNPADADGKGDVGGFDAWAFGACATGPGIPQTALACQWARLDGDEDVDQADFAVFQRCVSGGNVSADPECAGLSPHVAYYDNSGCLGTPMLGDGYPWCGDDVIEVTVDRYSLRVVHRNATYNCCPDDIRVELTVVGNALILDEAEIVTLACPCLCCFDVESTIVSLPPGDYWLDYCWVERGTGTTCDSQPIRIP